MQVNGGSPQTIPWYTASGQQNIAPHPLNLRQQSQVINEYIMKMKQFGCIPGVRGEAWLVAPSAPGEPYLAISWGSLSRAFYAAHLEDPDNVLLQVSAKRGLTGAIVFESGLPDDCVEWLRDWHNQWHSGSGVSFCQTLQLCPKVDAQWSAHADAMGWTWRGGGTDGTSSFEARRWSFVDAEFNGSLKSKNFMESCLRLWGNLRDLNIFE
jgi:hypothetical protein